MSAAVASRAARQSRAQVNRLQQYAGRHAIGSVDPVVVSKHGIRHRMRLENGKEEEHMVIGAACSEVFSGPRLAKVLRPAMELQMQALECLEKDIPAPCLSQHTSTGVPPALEQFLERLEPHLPWSDTKEDDWFVSVQLEGASAVWAACDLLLQLQHTDNDEMFASRRSKVAVGMHSYHGPGFSSFGSTEPMGPKQRQIKYPVPSALAKFQGEEDEAFHARIVQEIDYFLAAHGHEIGVLLVEPQWGSSLAAQTWPPHVLRHLVREAQSKGILVCSDEIMCGLGRHGQGTSFLCEATGMEPDAVTFGKAVGAGQGDVLSGVALRRGAAALGSSGRSVLQMHTYAGSSSRALLSAAAVLDELPSWYDHIAAAGKMLSTRLEEIRDATNGSIIVNGSGLMQGALFAHPDRAVRRHIASILRQEVSAAGVMPYIVPSGGFMITPVVDVDLVELDEACNRLQTAVVNTMASVDWHGNCMP